MITYLLKLLLLLGVDYWRFVWWLIIEFTLPLLVFTSTLIWRAGLNELLTLASTSSSASAEEM